MKRNMFVTLVLVSICLLLMACNFGTVATATSPVVSMTEEPTQAVVVPDAVLPTATTEISTEIPVLVATICPQVGIPSSDGSLAYNQIQGYSCDNVSALHDKYGDIIAVSSISDAGIPGWSDSPQFWLVTTTDGDQFWLDLLDMRGEAIVQNTSLIWNHDAQVYCINERSIPTPYIFPKNPNPGP